MARHLHPTSSHSQPPPAKKSLGQHFLDDSAVISRLIELIHPQIDDRLIEIGPGRGALTTELLPHLSQLDVIEIDGEILPTLQANCHGSPKLKIHHQDVLRCNWENFSAPWRLVGNLPYNISTPLLLSLMPWCSKIIDCHFMLQREVAERIAAKPGSKNYGRLSVMLQYHCAAQLLLPIPPTAFTPPPAVESAFIRLIPYPTPPFLAQNKLLFQQIVRESFSTRRKTLRNCLKKYLSADQLTQLNIDPNARPEQLTVEYWVKLSNFIAAAPDIHPN